MVAFGRPKGYRGSYKQWVEGGIPPQVVFEVLSPGNRYIDTIRKFRFYERYGVEEYYVYNPDNGDLAGWLRGDSGLEDVAEINGFISPRLGVRFEPGEGSDRLRILAPDGRPFLTYVELVEERDAERLRAGTAEQLAETERQRPRPNASAPNASLRGFANWGNSLNEGCSYRVAVDGSRNGRVQSHTHQGEKTDEKAPAEAGRQDRRRRRTVYISLDAILQ